MKIEKLTVNYPADKLNAIKIHAPEMYAGLEKQLTAALEKIYMKCVPAPTRKYIEAVMNEDGGTAAKGGKP